MPSFEIVELDAQGKPRPFPAGVFPNGATASSVIASLSAQYPNKKFQPRPIKDETQDWKARERRRFEEGVYEPINIGLKEVTDHFAHKAVKTPANVAYTPSPEYGVTDRQTSIHINAYLNRFYPNLDIETKRKIIWDYCGENPSDGLHFAYTRDEIADVYTSGPGSCMSESSSEYNDKGIHPTEAYSGPDLAIAYIKDTKGRITARCLTWPDKKIYNSIYGDGAKLREALSAEGYNQGDNAGFTGARLTAINLNNEAQTKKYGPNWLCPYLDVVCYVYLSDDEQHLIMGRHPTDNKKTFSACNTSGSL